MLTQFETTETQAALIAASPRPRALALSTSAPVVTTLPVPSVPSEWSRPALADPVREIERQAEQVNALVQRARQSVDARLKRADDDIAHTKARLLALSPAATLRRGYAIVQHADATVVRSATEVSAGEPLTVRLAEDQLTVAVIPRGDSVPPGDKVPEDEASGDIPDPDGP